MDRDAPPFAPPRPRKPEEKPAIDPCLQLADGKIMVHADPADFEPLPMTLSPEVENVRDYLFRRVALDFGLPVLVDPRRILIDPAKLL